MCHIEDEFRSGALAVALNEAACFDCGAPACGVCSSCGIAACAQHADAPFCSDGREWLCYECLYSGLAILDELPF